MPVNRVPTRNIRLTYKEAKTIYLCRIDTAKRDLLAISKDIDRRINDVPKYTAFDLALAEVQQIADLSAKMQGVILYMRDLQEPKEEDWN